jgi:hypothetical protein
LISLLITDYLNIDVSNSGWGTLWYRKKHEAFERKKGAPQLTPEYDEEEK